MRCDTYNMYEYLWYGIIIAGEQQEVFEIACYQQNNGH